MLDAILGQGGFGAPRGASAAPSAPDAPAKSAQARAEQVKALAVRVIAALDEVISRQVDAILHHPSFQRLEASWRGLALLVAARERDGATRGRIKLVVMNIRWAELARDAERALEFDGTSLFWRVYEQEFGSAGGEPYGVLLGDYQVRHRYQEGDSIDDIGLLGRIAETASAAFAPFVAGVHPSFFGVSEFSQLERHVDLDRMFRQDEYGNWRRLRSREDSRFIGLVVPRILMRTPYDEGTAVARIAHCPACGARRSVSGKCAACAADFDPVNPRLRREERLGFCYREDVSGDDRSRYLWGNGAYAFGLVLIRAFQECGWFADIRGFERNRERGGVVTGLAIHEFGLDSPGVSPKASVDVIIDDVMEKEFAEQGFIPLCALHDTPFCAFFSNRSIYSAKTYTTAAATVNERMSAMLQYTLCVGRFAHHLKAHLRDATGSVTQAVAMENRLRDWLFSYVNPDQKAAPDVKAKYPLNSADVEVRETPGKPGHYQCVMRLTPHYQLDDMLITVRVKTEQGQARRT